MKKREQKKYPYLFCSLFRLHSDNNQIYRLCLNNRACRTCAFASTAIDAGICVDLVLSVALRDSFDGAGSSASAAADAGIINNTCHFVDLLSSIKENNKEF